MSKFEYRIFNLVSDTAAMQVNVHENGKTMMAPKTWIEALNVLGREGWEYTGTQPTKTSMLLKREVT